MNGSRKPVIDDHGLTLVELIVSILIMSVVTGMVAMFLSSARSTYREVATDAVLQDEADTARKFINELALEARDWTPNTGDGYLEYTDATTGKKYPFIWLTAPDNDVEALETGVLPQYFYYVFLKREDGRLAYGKYEYDELLGSDGNLFGTGFAFPTSDEYGNNIIDADDQYAVLAEHVMAIRNIHKDTGNNLLTVSLVLSYDGKTYDTTMNVAARNKLK